MRLKRRVRALLPTTIQSRAGHEVAWNAVAPAAEPPAPNPPANKPLAISPLVNGAAVDRLRLLTLNVAHGRSIRAHQALVSNGSLERNLTDIASTVRRLSPDVVALQEADGPSAWSGNFDHVATLARMTEMDEYFRGDHNPFRFGRLKLASGTALLSRVPLVDPGSHRFEASWRDTKGFVVARVGVPAWEGQEIDIASVHLDFLTPAMRRKHIRHLTEVLMGRERPLVLLGDLNCCWQREPGTMRLLTETLGLKAFEPEARVPTYPSRRPRRRLDWILISRELAFSSYRTVPARLSDHLGVVADVVRR